MPQIEVSISETFGWRLHRHGPLSLWFKGWITGLDGDGLAARLADLPAPVDNQTLCAHLLNLDGHFAFVASCPTWTIAAVDWVRSIPLAVTEIDGQWFIDDRPNRLRRRAGLGISEIDRDAARAIAMGGYTIGTASLYQGLNVLGPGELIVFRNQGRPETSRYYAYRPWLAEKTETRVTTTDLAETTLDIMQRTLDSLHGRTLVVPLSAGNDSRLIVSAAKHLGYKDVRCFTYGRAGNFEITTSQAIAEKLGYPWRIVHSTSDNLRRFFAGDAYAQYLEYADCCTAVPFVQDMWPLQSLKADGFIPTDAVIANGNSGDYISGLHISPTMQQPQHNLAPQQRREQILQALYDKHFALWQHLRTASNQQQIMHDLQRSTATVAPELTKPEFDYGFYEYAEFQDRQCKYVITGERIYEFLGHEWRLPLWDNAYLRFWEKVPLAEKLGQSLYGQMLKSENWGGVWQNIPVNHQNIRPLGLIPLRWIAKALHAPLGRKRWHKFERQYFQYWMDPTCNSACIPYWQAAKDQRIARNSVAWLSEQYLTKHEISLDEFAPA